MEGASGGVRIVVGKGDDDGRGSEIEGEKNNVREEMR